MKRIGIILAVGASSLLSAMDVKDINILEIVEQIKSFAQNSPQINDVGALVGRKLEALPYTSLGFTKDDLERLVRGEVSPNLADVLKKRLNLTDADLAALRMGRITDALREHIAQEAQKGIALLHRVTPQVRNVETAIELIKSPILTKIVRPENLTPEFKAAAEQLIVFTKQNREFVASIKGKIAQIITIVSEMLKTELSTVQSVPTDVGAWTQILKKIESAISPTIQAIVKEVQSLDKTKLQEIFNAFKNVDYSKINFDGIKKDLIEFRATLS